MEYYVAWWNLENLFDIENSPQRPSELQQILEKELEGWTKEILTKKISQLAKIILSMNNGNGPDVLGIAEIENGPVIEKLVNALNSNLNHRNYSHADVDSDEKRGIEVALVYDQGKFDLDTGDIISHTILRRGATRNILQVNFTTKFSGTKLVIIGNHWPARSAGVLETEPYRIAAGESINYFHKEALKKFGENTAVLVMGDFNDEPFNRSLTDYALSTNSLSKLADSTVGDPHFFNLMWPFLGSGLATYCYKNYDDVFKTYLPDYVVNNSPKECYYIPNDPQELSRRYHRRPPEITLNILDQFFVSKEMIFGNKLKVKIDSVKILFEDLKEELCNHPQRYLSPRKFGRPSQKVSYDPDGFSDHFPISLLLEEKDNSN